MNDNVEQSYERKELVVAIKNFLATLIYVTSHSGNTATRARNGLVVLKNKLRIEIWM